MKSKYLFLALILTGCTPIQPIPQNYSPTINQTINQTPVINTTNITIVEPPKPEPILIPIKDKLAVYILDTSVSGGSIITSGQQSLVLNVQGGSDELRELKILKNLGINNPTYLVASNNEENNIAGIPPLIVRMKPLNLFQNGIPSGTTYQLYNQLFPNTTIISHDYIFGIGDALGVIEVPYDDGLQLTDDNTMVLQITYGGTKVLFTSDCKTDCESRIKTLPSNIIVSNGNCNSLSLSFLMQTNPETVIFSGKPCQETLDRIKSLDLKYYTTSDSGDIQIVSDGINYTISSLKTK